VRVRLIQLRILGAALAALWLAAWVLVLVGYRPGGPADLLVGVAAVGPALIALAAVRWPPVARGGRAFAGIAWLALASILLLIPSLAGLVGQLTVRGPQTLLPSLEAAYPWLLALMATGLFTGLGLARRRLGETSIRRRRLVSGGLAALLMVVGAGTAFSAAAIANELALAERPANASRFGPTDPTLTLPDCTAPVVAGPTARLQLRMDGSLDGRYTGQVVLDGRRDGGDVTWTGFSATRYALGQQGLTRVGDRTWVLAAGNRWTEAPPGTGAGWDADRQLVAVALTPADANAPEDRGLAFIDGARARHCRITIDGTIARRTLPAVALLVGDTDVSRWRGTLDFWVFADGQLGQVDGQLSGPATDLGDEALQAGVRFQVLAFDRGDAMTVQPPGR
jgi:hypothetical protein